MSLSSASLRWNCVALVALVGGVSCAVSTPWIGAPRPVAGAPDHFSTDTAASGGVTAPGGTITCMVHLIDLQSGTRLRLVHSARQGNLSNGALEGDYAVEPPRRYGLMTGEGLRINCASGQILGAVPLNSH